MKKLMSVTANLYDPSLLKNLVEKLATQHIDMGYHKAIVPQQCKAIETSSTQAYVMGTFDLSIKGIHTEEQLSVPFTSCFLFTCTKEKYGLFNLEWGSSLS